MYATLMLFFLLIISFFFLDASKIFSLVLLIHQFPQARAICIGFLQLPTQSATGWVGPSTRIHFLTLLEAGSLR